MKRLYYPAPAFTVITVLSLSVFSTAAYSETVQVIVRTFIPKEHPSKPGYMLPIPGNPSKTMLPDAPLTAQCFGTDNRNFENDVNASSRFGGIVTFDTSAPTASFSEITGTTTEHNCSDGSVVCTEVAGKGGFTGTSGANGDEITFAYAGEASNPCLTLAPDIEFTGTITLDTSSRTVAITGKVDVFPSFEAFIVREDGSSEMLYNTDPKDGATPGDLVSSPGGGSRNVSGSANY